MKCTFMGFPCELRFARYLKTGNITVELVANNPDASRSDLVHGEHVCYATTNIDRLEDDRIAIKNWMENAGMEKALFAAGIIEAMPCDYLPSGYVLAPVHMLTPAGLAEVRQAGGI